MGHTAVADIVRRLGKSRLERLRRAKPNIFSVIGAPLWRFRPRPDRPELFDQQTAFLESRDQVAFLLGGNGSGKTESAAVKVARFLLHEQPPPRRDTPFWIVSNTYYQVCAVCWGEKLYGRGYIPDSEIDWARVRWLSPREGWPRSVPLKPWPNAPGKNWVLEFHSYEQGRANLQARSIGGFWLSEQFSWDVLQEALRGCREYMFPGGQIAEFTPIDPELCLRLEELLDHWPAGWGLYRLNTECNRPHLAADWYANFIAAIPDEMRATRLTGALATYEGAIFQTFNPAIHVSSAVQPGIGGRVFAGIDWGASAEHPFAAVWGWRSDWGDWIIFDEYWCNRQDFTLADHAREIQERAAKWQLSQPLEAIADSENAMAIAQFNQWGIPTSSARKDVLDSIDVIRALLKVQPATEKPRLVIAERCTHTIEELRKYRWEKRRGTDGKLAPARPLKSQDDCVDALRYMIYTAEMQTSRPPGTLTYRRDLREYGIPWRRHER